MKTTALIFFGIGLGAGAARAGTTWSWVSAADPAQAVAAVTVDPPTGEEVVRFIPAAPSAPPPLAAARPVVGMALPETGEDVASPAAATPPVAADTIPVEALWPDHEGLIAEARPSAVPLTRNPWESRAKTKAKGRTAAFDFGGYIGGGPGGPVAIVNGRGRRKGEDADGFVVARIAAGGIVLARAGVLYVVPPRRRVTIELPAP